MMNEIIESFDLFSFLLGCFMTGVLCSVGFSLGVWAKKLDHEIMQLEGGDMIELLRRMRTSSPPPLETKKMKSVSHTTCGEDDV